MNTLSNYTVNLANPEGATLVIGVDVKDESLVIEKSLEIIDRCWFIPNDCFVVDYVLTVEGNH